MVQTTRKPGETSALGSFRQWADTELFQALSDPGLSEFGRSQIIETLVKRYKPLVHALARELAGRFPRLALNIEDLRQAGFCGTDGRGLIAAINNFDYRRAVAFATFATKWIRGSILSALGEQLQSVRIPWEDLKYARSLVVAETELTIELRRTPRDLEVLRRMKIRRKRKGRGTNEYVEVLLVDVVAEKIMARRHHSVLENELEAELARIAKENLPRWRDARQLVSWTKSIADGDDPEQSTVFDDSLGADTTSHAGTGSATNDDADHGADGAHPYSAELADIHCLDSSGLESSSTGIPPDLHEAMLTLTPEEREVICVSFSLPESWSTTLGQPAPRACPAGASRHRAAKVNITRRLARTRHAALEKLRRALQGSCPSSARHR